MLLTFHNFFHVVSIVCTFLQSTIWFIPVTDLDLFRLLCSCFVLIHPCTSYFISSYFFLFLLISSYFFLFLLCFGLLYFMTFILVFVKHLSLFWTKSMRPWIMSMSKRWLHYFIYYLFIYLAYSCLLNGHEISFYAYHLSVFRPCMKKEKKMKNKIWAILLACFLIIAAHYFFSILVDL